MNCLRTIRLFSLLVLVLLLVGGQLTADSPAPFRLMSFNVWVGGTRGGQPLSQTAKVMYLADVVGVQESVVRGTDNSVEIARILGWNHLHQHSGNAVVSRFPISGCTPGRHGVFIQLPGGNRICLFNLHLAHAPYQPYQLLGIPYEDGPFINSESEAVEWANRSRGGQVSEVLIEIQTVRDQGIPVFVTGDFNEPSHQDWTARAAAQSIHPIKVAYPATKRITEAGLVDAFRQVYGDEVARPGFTWTPLTRPDAPWDHHDRIDFVFADRRVARVLEAQVVGEAKPAAEIVVSPWPSDHRAVLATIELSID